MQEEDNLEDLYIKLIKAKLQKHWKTVGSIIILFTGASVFVSFLLPSSYSMTYGLLIGNYQYRNAAFPLESTAKIRKSFHSNDGFMIKEAPPYLEISAMEKSEDDVRLKAKKTVDDLVNRHNAILDNKKGGSLIIKQIRHLEDDLAKEEEEEVTKLIGRLSVDSVARAMYTTYIRERTDKASERLDDLYLQRDLNFNPTTIEYEEGPKKLSSSLIQSTTIGFLFGILASLLYLYFKKDPDITSSLMHS